MAPRSFASPSHAAGVPGEAPARVSVVGGGRLGTALAGALASKGIEVEGPFGRGEPVANTDAVILCVPDAEIPAAAAASAGVAPLIGHTSGATGLGALAPAGATAFGLHPLQTFAGGEGPERFAGAGCAIAGEAPAALAAARSLAQALGLRPFELTDKDRSTYHAAASIASNFTITLLAEAERVAGAAGIEPAQARSLLAPLVRSTVENWATLGPWRALTGPVARGDEATVERQRAAVVAAAPELEPLFDDLVVQTRALAGQGAEAIA
jgi:predicted short-subunit dehydrogenase-like oxidoreductase (DUF2520 family)